MKGFTNELSAWAFPLAPKVVTSKTVPLIAGRLRRVPELHSARMARKAKTKTKADFSWFSK